MSGIVKAVKKVFKSATNVVSKVASGVTKVAKKIVKSKVFKVAAMAAVAYFGGAALMSVANGGTFASGLSSAWTGVQSAGSALMSGDFSGAAKALGSGFTGGSSATTAAKIATSPPLSSSSLSNVSSGVMGGGGGGIKMAASKITSTLTPALTAPTATAPAAGLLGLGEAGTAALITGGINMGGQMIQGYAAEKQAEEQQKNLNYWGVNGNGNGGGLPMPGLLTPPMQQPNFNMTPQTPRTIDELIKRQQQQVNQYPTWG